ncbi:MAG: hypothetical protein ACYDHX_09510 [Methanothrix sp.]
MTNSWNMDKRIKQLRAERSSAPPLSSPQIWRALGELADIRARLHRAARDCAGCAPISIPRP